MLLLLLIIHSGALPAAAPPATGASSNEAWSDVSPAPAKAPASAVPEELRPGDIRIEGLILAVDHPAGLVRIQLSARSVQTAVGSAVVLHPPRLKTVTLARQMPVSGGDPFAATADDVAAGQSIVVTGPDLGVGRTLMGRAVTVEADPPLDLEQSAYEVYQEVAEMRLREGLDLAGRGLRWNAILAGVAARRAAYTASLLDRGHPFDLSLHLDDDDPNGASVLMTRSGYPHSHYMENLELTGQPDPVNIFRAWEKSPEHAANYRIPALQDAGVAIHPLASDPGHYIVMMDAGAPRSKRRR